MADTKQTSGIGIGTIIAFILIILKATDNIDMSWFLVLTSFIWAPILSFLAIFILIIIIVGIVEFFK